MIHSDNFKLIKHLADINDSNGHNIELNYGQWYNNDPIYDLRKPDTNKYGGFTITPFGAKKLAITLGKEFGIFEDSYNPISNYVLDFSKLLVVGNINWCIEQNHSYKDIQLFIPTINNSKYESKAIAARFDSIENVFFTPESEFNRIEYSICCGYLFFDKWIKLKKEFSHDELAIQTFFSKYH